MLLLLMTNVLHLSAYQNDYENTTDKNTLICFDAETGEIQYIPANYDAQGALLSLGYEGDVEKIDAAYAKINAQYYEETFISPSCSPLDIIGNDDRTKVDAEICVPYSMICRLDIIWPNGNESYATGWLYARDRVATAGHCVYNAEKGGWAALIIVQPGRYGEVCPFGETAVPSTGLASCKGWTENSDFSYDYGLIRLNEPLGDVCGYFGYAGNSGSIGTNVTISGYPGDKNPYTNDQNQWKMRGKLTLVTSNRLWYLIDTYAGQSGAPIYNDNRTVIGIHSSGYTVTNAGTKISVAIFNHMQNF